jgi:pimeloyl-ACP methyl ester carboxylesterase
MSQRGSAVVICLLVASPASALDARKFKLEFQATQNSWERRALIRQLDPDDPDSQKVLLNVILKTQDWYLRQAAVDVLALAYDLRSVDRLKKHVSDDPLVASGVTLAFRSAGGNGVEPKERLDLFADALDHKALRVRRAAAIALGSVKTKDAIGTLVTAGTKEESFLVRRRILASLQRLTGDYGRQTPEHWEAWWAREREAFALPAKATPPPEPVPPLEGRFKGVRLSARVQGNGAPVVVLADLGLEVDVVGRFLTPLEADHRMVYVDLPMVHDFDPELPNAPGRANPEFPVLQVAAALRGLQRHMREEGLLETERWTVLAHGRAAWVALELATIHPKSLDRAILVAPHPGGDAALEASKALEYRGQEKGDLELEHLGAARQFQPQLGKPLYQAAPGDESEALRRKAFTIRFADPSALEVGDLLGPVVKKSVGRGSSLGPAAFRPFSHFLDPRWSASNLSPTRVKTLLLHGDRSLELPLDGAKTLAKRLGKRAKLVRFKRSADFPFVEEHSAFMKAVRKFLGSKSR